MNRIKELREQRNWLQRDLEEKLNLGRGNISKYEKEDRSLSPALICQLCDLFGVTADYLLGRSDTPNPTLSEEDAALLRAYHLATLRDRGLIDQILQAYVEADAEGKSVV